MKKTFTFVLLLAAAFVTASADTTYPRKFLIEHFTTELCGYCPYGMYSIVEGIKGQEDQYIWVSHHYGYGTDQYTIPENSTIGSFLGVSGAPSMALNRTSRTTPGGSGICFHPGYLPDLTITDSKEALVSVNIDHTYDAATRLLTLNVNGEVGTDQLTELHLSVLIKENGLIGKQTDYYYSWVGAWTEFMHTRVVRDMLTAAKGDKVEFPDGKYDWNTTFTIPDTWVAENCVIVAYVTNKADKPIINAEQAPLVAGTTGGEEIEPHGITQNVSETYPESGAPIDNIKFTKVIQTVSDQGLSVVLVADTILAAGGKKCRPVLMIDILTDTELVNGTTYTITDSGEPNTIVPGYRDDVNMVIAGTQLRYCTSTEINTGKYTAIKTWMLKSGNLSVNENGNITINATSANGSDIIGNYTADATALDKISFVKQAMKQIRNGQLILINANGEEYNVNGARIK